MYLEGIVLPVLLLLSENIKNEMHFDYNRLILIQINLSLKSGYSNLTKCVILTEAYFRINGLWNISLNLVYRGVLTMRCDL